MSFTESDFNALQAQLIEVTAAKFDAEQAARRLKLENDMLKKDHSAHGPAGAQNAAGAQNSPAGKSKVTSFMNNLGGGMVGNKKEVTHLQEENDALRKQLRTNEADQKTHHDAMMSNLTQLEASRRRLDHELEETRKQLLAATTNAPGQHTATVATQAASAAVERASKLQAEKAILQEKLDATQKLHGQEKAQLQADLEALRAEHAALEQRHQQSLLSPPSTEAAAAEATEATSANAQLVARLQAELAASAATTAALRAKLDASEASHRGLEAKLLDRHAEDELKIQLETAVGEKANLALQLTAATEQLATVQKQLAARSTETKTGPDYKRQYEQLQLQFTDYKKAAQASDAKLSETITNLQFQLSQSSSDSTKHMDALQFELEKATQELTDSRTQVKVGAEATQQVGSLASQVTSLQAKVTLLDGQLDEERKQTESLRTENAKVKGQLDELTKVADKRKALLDDMSRQKDDLVTKHNAEAEANQMEKIKAIAEAKSAFNRLSNDLEAKLKTANDELATANTTIQQLTEQKAALEQSLQDASANKAALEGQLQTARDTIATHEASLAQATVDAAAAAQAAAQAQTASDERIAALTAEIETSKASIEELNKAIEDRKAETVAAEKRNAVMLKDLKRQLLLEKKKSDKMEVDLKHNDTPSSSSGSHHGSFDQGSSGSARVSVELGRAKRDLSSEFDTASSQATQDMTRRLQALQSEKTVLAEKVKMLEDANGAMVDDVMRKSFIIRKHFIDRVDASPTGARKPLPTVAQIKKVGEAPDTPLKLQLALEEAQEAALKAQDNCESIKSELVRAQNELTAVRLSGSLPATPQKPPRPSEPGYGQHASVASAASAVENHTADSASTSSAAVDAPTP
ncbi:hypothetical protein CAOG_009514 [Capsaspora owczarzaki ATCC 30864]|uniref:Uncharacterized protein n=2 Tax=Capsaspora owczarzaki (strain ATCC 30864) TaxID=595528 RepID=A0A0D2X1L8_CAPO3|nr:hypothetical protein CAOG_009514 [Capsaspora owczarzaki ATCC 30864]